MIGIENIDSEILILQQIYYRVQYTGTCISLTDKNDVNLNRMKTSFNSLTCSSNAKQGLKLCVELTRFLSHFRILFVISYLKDEK